VLADRLVQHVDDGPLDLDSLVAGRRRERELHVGGAFDALRRDLDVAHLRRPRVDAHRDGRRDIAAAKRAYLHLVRAVARVIGRRLDMDPLALLPGAPIDAPGGGDGLPVGVAKAERDRFVVPSIVGADHAQVAAAGRILTGCVRGPARPRQAEMAEPGACDHDEDSDHGQRRGKRSEPAAAAAPAKRLTARHDLGRWPGAHTRSSRNPAMS